MPLTELEVAGSGPRTEVPAGTYKCKLVEIAQIDNRFNPGTTRLAYIFNVVDGPMAGKRVVAYASPSSNSPHTKTIIEHLTGNPITAGERLKVNVEEMLDKAEKAGKNAFIIWVTPAVRPDGTQTVKVASITPEGK